MRLLESRMSSLYTISEHYKDVSTLIEAKIIAKNLDRGECTSDEEIKKFINIKEDY